jgi:hypothetical protein
MAEFVSQTEQMFFKNPRIRFRKLSIPNMLCLHGFDGEGLGLGCGDGPGSPEVEFAPDGGDGIGVAEPVDVVKPLSDVVKGLAIGRMENEDDADGGSEVSNPDHANRPPAAATQMWSQTFSQSTSA